MIHKKVHKLHQSLQREFAEWVESPVTNELFFEDSVTNKLEAYLEGRESPLLLTVACGRLVTWYIHQYSYAALSEGRLALNELALASRYGIWAVRFAEAMVPHGQQAILEHEAAFYFSLPVISGWGDDAETVGSTLVRGLDTGLLEAREGAHLYRHFWFLLQLYAKVKRSTLNVGAYDYPKQMHPYSVALEHWHTTDQAQVAELVSLMADFHIEQSRDMTDDEVTEFDSVEYRLFPHEILTFLRVREWFELPNPAQFDHPLMRQPLAQLPPPVPPPQTPLLDRVIDKFKREYPSTFADK